MRIANLPQMLRSAFVFTNTYHFLGKSQYWSSEQLQEYQLKQLIKLVWHSYKNIPFYKERWERADFHPDDLKTLDDIKRIPFTTKQDMRECMASQQERYCKAKLINYVTTGGSAGTPLGFFEEKYVAMAREMAFIYRLWERAGYRIGDKRVVLRGKTVSGAKNGKFGYIVPVRRELRLSSNYMTDENLPSYIKMIDDFRAPFIHAYPSAITILADYMKRKGIAPFRFLKAILVGSESLYAWQKELLQDVFQCRVYSWYGHSEKAVLAGACEERYHYHIFPEYGIMELVDANGNTISEKGRSGEIVATGFNNYVTPFIRYRTMDIGVYGASQCPCGRAYPILEKVEGRLQDYIVTTGGSRVSLTSFIFAQHFTAFSRIKQMQLIQDKAGVIKVRIARFGEYSRNDEDELRRVMLGSVNGQLEIDFEYVEQIEKTPGGKHRFLIQTLPIVSGGKHA